MPNLPAPYFYTFFFTHKSQVLPPPSSTSIEDFKFSWLRVNLPTPYPQLPFQRSDNIINLKIAPSQFGNIFLSTPPPAIAFFNVSFTPRCSSSIFRASSTTQPGSYTSVISIANSEPKSYTGDWFYDPITPDQHLTFPLQRFVDVEEVDEFGVSTTITRSFYEIPFGFKKVNNPVDNSSEIFVQRVPYGETQVQLTAASSTPSNLSSDDIYSHSYAPIAGRGYLPNHTLHQAIDYETDYPVRGCYIRDLGTSLTTLVLLDNQGDLIYLCLQELCFLWRLIKEVTIRRIQMYTSFGGLPEEVVVTEGLPSFLPAFSDPYNTSDARVTLDQAWLGIGILKACEYLRDRSHTQALPIPKDLPELLRELASAVASTIDPIRGAGFLGFDEYGKLIEKEDFPSLVAAQIFLSDYCSRQYDARIHLIAARAYSAIDHLLYTDPSRSYSNLNQARIHLYKLVWLLKYNQFLSDNAFLKKLAQLTVERLVDSTIEPISFSDYQLFSLILGALGLNQIGLPTNVPPLPGLPQVITKYPVWNAFEYLTIHAPGLYSYSSNQLRPELHASSWLILASSSLTWHKASEILFPVSSFALGALDADAYYSYSFQLLKRMWPYGLKWSSDRAISLEEGGILAALFASTAQTTRSWYLSYALARDGCFLHLASGYYLDLWGKDLSYDRPLLQSDSYYRKTLLTLITKDGVTVRGLKNLAHSLGIHVFLKEPAKQFTFFYRVFSEDGKSFVYDSKVWEGTPEDFLKVKNTGEGEPGFFFPLIPTQGEYSPMRFIKWTEFAPKLTAFLSSTEGGFGKVFLNNVGAGVYAKIVLRPYTTPNVIPVKSTITGFIN